MSTTQIKKIVFYSIITFCFLFGFYVLTSNGLGNKPFYLQFRRFIPMSIVLVTTIAIIKHNVQRSFFTSFALVALFWAATFPIIYKANFTETMPFFSNHFDIVFACYSFIGLTALVFLLLKKSLSTTAIAGLSVIQSVLILIPLFQIAYYLYYGTCISETAILSIYQTNLQEAKEYVLQAIGYSGLIALLVAVISMFASLYALNKITLKINTDAKIGKKSLIFLLIAALGANGYAFGNALPQTGIFLLNSNVRNYFKLNNEFTKNRKQTLNDLHVISPLQNTTNPSTVIVVIGESASRTFMSAFADTKNNTTPWLKAQKNNPDFLLFPHAYTSRVNTVMALERALTEKSQYNDKKFNESATIIDIAKKAGYKTYWFSNQGTMDVADTPNTLVGQTADVYYWTNENPSIQQYDGSLLKYLDNVSPNENNFIVLHLMGSHDNYQNRYPEEFAKWGNPEINEPIINYDNSLYYTDWVLQQIHAYAKDKLNLQTMVYFSDHGTVPDYKRNPDVNPFAANRIPLFIYLSSEYQELYPQTTKALQDNQNKYFTNDLVYELVCGLLNIKSNRYDETQSIASDKYKYTRETLRTNLGATPLTDDKEEN